MRKQDLTGQRFGKLVALHVTRDEHNLSVWFCQCDCGNTTLVYTSGLNSGRRISCGCQRSPDLSGQKFFRITVVSKSHLKKKRQHYNCVCDCGKEVVVANSKLLNGHTKSCGCLKGDVNRESNKRLRKPYGIAVRNSIVTNYKQNARNKGNVFELRDEQVVAFLEGNCYYCGVEPMTVSTRAKTYGEYRHNGIDRLDNSKGYTTENCVSCCAECNYRKGSQHHDDFLAWIKRVAINLNLVEVKRNEDT